MDNSAQFVPGSDSGTDPRFVHNHQVDPETGFIVSPGFANAFDPKRKNQFLDVYRANGLRLRRACRSMGLSESTVSHHLRIDPVFKDKFDGVEADYIEDLEQTSRDCAMNPKFYVERIFQLKCLRPEKYGQENRPFRADITINIDGKVLEMSQKRETIIDAKIVQDQEKRVLTLENSSKIDGNNAL